MLRYTFSPLTKPPVWKRNPGGFLRLGQDGSACGRVRAEPDRVWDGVPTSDHAGRNVLTFLPAWSVLVSDIFAIFFACHTRLPTGQNSIHGKNAIPPIITFIPRKISFIPRKTRIIPIKRISFPISKIYYPRINDVFPPLNGGFYPNKRYLSPFSVNSWFNKCILLPLTTN